MTSFLSVFICTTLLPSIGNGNILLHFTTETYQIKKLINKQLVKWTKFSLLSTLSHDELVEGRDQSSGIWGLKTKSELRVLFKAWNIFEGRISEQSYLYSVHESYLLHIRNQNIKWRNSTKIRRNPSYTNCSFFFK